MDILSISIATFACYFLATVSESFDLMGYWRHGRGFMLLFGFLGVCFHGLLLHHWIDLDTVENLNFFNLLSLTVWLISILVIAISLFRSIEALVIFAFPIAAISIFLVLRFPEVEVVQTSVRPDAVFHILLSILTFCVFCVAGLLAILLALQDSLLRRKQGNNFMSYLPPLESLEYLLFQVIGFGFIFLSALIVTSLYFYHKFLFTSLLMHKLILALSAWFIFMTLLTGRLFWGWYGRMAIYGTLSGWMLLLIAYFASKVLLKVLH